MKTSPAKTVEAYLAAVPEPAHTTLQAVRASIRSALPPQATEVISYGVPAFALGKTLVWYAAFSKHCSFFPSASVIDAFRDELGPYKLSKGTIQFPIVQPLPAALIRKMVRMRLAAIGAKPRTGKPRKRTAGKKRRLA